MEISLAGVEGRNAVYWRSRAQESRETARRMMGTAPRRGMLEIAEVYERLAILADLDRRPRDALSCRSPLAGTASAVLELSRSPRQQSL